MSRERAIRRTVKVGTRWRSRGGRSRGGRSRGGRTIGSGTLQPQVGRTEPVEGSEARAVGAEGTNGTEGAEGAEGDAEDRGQRFVAREDWPSDWVVFTADGVAQPPREEQIARGEQSGQPERTGRNELAGADPGADPDADPDAARRGSVPASDRVEAFASDARSSRVDRLRRLVSRLDSARGVVAAASLRSSGWRGSSVAVPDDRAARAAVRGVRLAALRELVSWPEPQRTVDVVLDAVGTWPDPESVSAACAIVRSAPDAGFCPWPATITGSNASPRTALT